MSENYIDKEVLAVIQEPIELVAEPFAPFAKKLGTDTETVLQKLKALIDTGVIRRFAGIVKHNKAGFGYNAMVAFEVEDNLCDEAGGKLSSLSFVSHCYKRTPYSDWPFNLYAMMHARDELEFNERISLMKSHVSYKSVKVLQSLKEYKKSHYLLKS
jgi:DNA-binding Lrp family transcriptional regulator